MGKKGKRSRWLKCPVCQMGWAEGRLFPGYDKRVGGLCGDWSMDQEYPCVGRLMPEEDYKRAAWRVPAGSPLPRFLYEAAHPFGWLPLTCASKDFLAGTIREPQTVQGETT